MCNCRAKWLTITVVGSVCGLNGVCIVTIATWPRTLVLDAWVGLLKQAQGITWEVQALHFPSLCEAELDECLDTIKRETETS